MIIQIFSAGIILWVLFIVFAYAKERYQKEKRDNVRIAYEVFFIIFAAIDTVLNLLYGTIVFLDIPREATLTRRLKRILSTYTSSSWRWRLARFFCTRLIEPWDKNHCSIK